jgi:hypothetical protein
MTAALSREGARVLGDPLLALHAKGVNLRAVWAHAQALRSVS